MEGFGVQNETEKKLITDDREDMKAGQPLAVGVTEADFENRIDASGPGDGERLDLAGPMVVRCNDRDGFG